MERLDQVRLAVGGVDATITSNAYCQLMVGVLGHCSRCCSDGPLLASSLWRFWGPIDLSEGLAELARRPVGNSSERDHKGPIWVPYSLA